MQRATHSNDGVEYRNDEVEVDHEFKRFERGYTVVDGDVQK
jgi:hypothetical protein